MSKLRDAARRVSQAIGITHQEPPVESRPPPELSTRPSVPDVPDVPPGEAPAHFWPAGKPLPASWNKRVIPCPACRRVQLPDGGQAAACRSTAADFAYFRCRACGHTWKLAVR